MPINLANVKSLMTDPQISMRILKKQRTELSCDLGRALLCIRPRDMKSVVLV